MESNTRNMLKRYRLLTAGCLALVLAGEALAATPDARDYSVYQSWSDMDKATDAKYATVTCVSGDKGYTGFWFFGAEQFDASNR